MNIRLICVGKLKEKYLQQGVAEYTKRLSAYCKLTIIEVKDEKAPETLSDAQMQMIKEKEGQAIAKYLREGAYTIALAIDGKQFSSEGLAHHIADLSVNGKSTVDLIIGGSLGIDDVLLKRADLLLSFSKMTFPHQLMRLILCEQIYRAYRIINNQPYHK
jgi:23S rRNA (pseudouridine1915-N3)-methyltransferase